MHLLLQGISGLVYTELIATSPSLQEQHRPYILPLLVEYSIPTPLLLVSKAFSGELRHLLCRLQDIGVYVHDPACNFVALLHRVPVRQYANFADDDTATKIGFMVCEALSGLVCQLSITLELPELHVMAALADQLVRKSAVVNVEVSAYNGEFLGFKFRRLVLQLQGTHGQCRLRAEMLLRSRNLHTRQT